MPASEQEQVAVALQIAGVANHQQREHVEHHAERGPGGLAPGLAGIPAGDDDVADAVEQRGQRQDDRVGVGRQPAVGHVGDQGQSEDDPEEGADVVRDLRLLPERGNDVEGDHQQRSEEKQAQFRAPFRLRAELVTRGAVRDGCVTPRANGSGEGYDRTVTPGEFAPRATPRNDPDPTPATAVVRARTGVGAGGRSAGRGRARALDRPTRRRRPTSRSRLSGTSASPTGSSPGWISGPACSIWPRTTGCRCSSGRSSSPSSRSCSTSSTRSGWPHSRIRWPPACAPVRSTACARASSSRSSAAGSRSWCGARTPSSWTRSSRLWPRPASASRTGRRSTTTTVNTSSTSTSARSTPSSPRWPSTRATPSRTSRTCR